MKRDSGLFSSAAFFLRLRRTAIFCGMLACIFCAGMQCRAQQSSFNPLSQPAASNPLLTSTIPPGTAFLFELERNFAAAVAEGGGKAFASFFDKDGMTLANRQAPLIGQAAIAAHAMWSPNTYQLTWTPEGGELSSAGDMGYTWGHYEGRSINAERPGGGSANSPVQRGRYMTVWKKESDGSWKVVLDSSNEDPPEPECKCSVNGK